MVFEKNKKPVVLVTGGAGLIGSNLVRRLTDSDFRVIVIDDLSRGKLEYLRGKDKRFLIDVDHDFYKADLSKDGVLDHILEAESVSYIYHLADVVGGIDYVFNNQGYVFRQNVLINSNVIEAARKHRRMLMGFIYVGTACSYPDSKQTLSYNRPLKEEDQYPASPESAYGWSKLMGEYEALLLEKEFDIPVSVISLHNVYGPPCDYDVKRSQVIPALINKAITYPDDDFIVWGSGKQGRAFVYVDDVVDALMAAMHNGLGQGMIQIGPDVCTSIKELAETIVDVSGKQITIRYDTSKPEGDEWRYADFGKASRILGWRPKIRLKDGVGLLYRWIQEDMSLNREEYWQPPEG